MDQNNQDQKESKVVSSSHPHYYSFNFFQLPTPPTYVNAREWIRTTKIKKSKAVSSSHPHYFFLLFQFFNSTYLRKAQWFLLGFVRYYFNLSSIIRSFWIIDLDPRHLSACFLPVWLVFFGVRRSSKKKY
jgi:hypothetical protein